jgi:TrmH family RNA methyltransferase
VERISSRQNPIVKRFRALAHASEHDAILLEGEHLVQEALAAGLPVEIVAVAQGAAARFAHLLAHAAAAGSRTIAVTEQVLTAVSPVRHSSGVVAIARRKSFTLEDVLARQPHLVLMIAGVQEPGNVGAIVRAAEACRATGLITGEGTADPFGWKALRGSMGSAFRLPIATKQPLAIAAEAARAEGLRLFASVPRGGAPLADCDFSPPSAIMLGGEGSGLPSALLEYADETLTIPMQPPVESLNVAIAAALILYEASGQRQRRVVRRRSNL